MVRDDPKPLGNESYFTDITMTKVEGDEYHSAYGAFHNHFAPDKTIPDGYRLDLKSVSGRTLKLYFFDYGNYAWAIWCTEKCDPMSNFMILNMSEKPPENP